MPTPDPISPEQVAHTARLARLRLDPEAIDAMRAGLAAILNHANELANLDLDNVEPLTHPLSANAPLADDRPAPPLTPDQVLNLAPRTDPPYIAVPKVIDPGADG